MIYSLALILDKNIGKYLEECKVQRIEDLPKHRRPYAKILKGVIDLLDKEPARDPWEHDQILKGFIRIVMSLLPSSGSRLKAHLIETIVPKGEKAETVQEQETQIKQAKSFYDKHVFVDGKADPDKRLDNNPFSFEGFDRLQFEKKMLNLLSAVQMKGYFRESNYSFWDYLPWVKTSTPSTEQKSFEAKFQP